MFISMLLRKKQFPQVAIWKMVIVDLWLLITGVIGTMILAFLETGSFGGTSFYGAVFLVPILILPALLLKISYREILNLCAPAECAILIVMRFDCLDKGCCFGKYLPRLGFQFPNQIVEMIAGAIVMAALIWIYHKHRKAWLYPWYMIFYGVLRSIMQCFRYGGTKPWVLGMSAGHLWSLVSVIIGILWLLVVFKRRNRENPG